MITSRGMTSSSRSWLSSLPPLEGPAQVDQHDESDGRNQQRLFSAHLRSPPLPAGESQHTEHGNHQQQPDGRPATFVLSRTAGHFRQLGHLVRAAGGPLVVAPAPLPPMPWPDPPEGRDRADRPAQPQPGTPAEALPMAGNGLRLRTSRTAAEIRIGERRERKQLTARKRAAPRQEQIPPGTRRRDRGSIAQGCG